jgi:hypothetical protein
MARLGRDMLSGKSLDANSAGPLTGTVLTAPFWATPSYKPTGFLAPASTWRTRSIDTRSTGIAFGWIGSTTAFGVVVRKP